MGNRSQPPTSDNSGSNRVLLLRLGVAVLVLLLLISGLVGWGAAFGAGTACTTVLDVNGSPLNCDWISWTLAGIGVTVVSAILGVIGFAGRHPGASLLAGLVALMAVWAAIMVMASWAF